MNFLIKNQLVIICHEETELSLLSWFGRSLILFINF